VDGFTAMLETAGGEIVHHPDRRSAGAWIRTFALDFDSATVGATVPHELRPAISTRGAHEAALGVSMARAAIAETGSLLMDARDGRKSQLLAPTHVVFVTARDVHSTFRGALHSVRDDLPSAIGLHSGPSKSADIAQTLVKGVHGPGRLIACVIESDPSPPAP
jgi:L-lactate dehydrogenase complex protein LldG